MPTSPTIILLDTMVVAGLFAITKTGSHVAEQKIEWRKAIESVTESLHGNYLLRVPTPVCFELMCWNKGWYDAVNNTANDIFLFKSYAISSQIINSAAKFAVDTKREGRDDDSKLKLKTIDPLIAAYSLELKHPILTENECDYPESHFSVLGVEILKLKGKDGKMVRKNLYLLSPVV